MLNLPNILVVVQVKIVCKYCGKSYTLADDLKTHELIHRKEKPHICKLCGKKITEADTLRIHIFIHYQDKPQLCKFSGN